MRVDGAAIATLLSPLVSRSHFTILSCCSCCFKVIYIGLDRRVRPSITGAFLSTFSYFFIATSTTTQLLQFKRKDCESNHNAKLDIMSDTITSWTDHEVVYQLYIGPASRQLTLISSSTSLQQWSTRTSSRTTR